MDKTYNPKDIEQQHYSRWENNGYFKPSGEGEPYCMMIPPPNVTGTLHMGHGFQLSLMDALIRYHRMQGYDTLWQVGTDHAGIATQMVVERQLQLKGETRQDLGRTKFVERVWDWKQQSGSMITKQMRRLGISVDWSRERFTMDDGLAQTVQKVFVELYREGLIYRGQRLVNWDPVLKTAVSDLEVLPTHEMGKLWHIRYPLVGEGESIPEGSQMQRLGGEAASEHHSLKDRGSIVIATTRPETMLGDTAVAVHPDDERYQHLIGKHIQLPLTDRQIPIISDESVDATFGTGCVKITPAHDFNDHQVGQRHDLPLINILNDDATLNGHVPEAYQGLDRFDAREKILDDLKAVDLLVQIDDHELTRPRGEKSGTVIEPYLTDQWFMKCKAMAKRSIDVVREGAITFTPKNWANTYHQWLENIEDWCISRQLWWGHQIPAWYDAEGRVYVGESESAIRGAYGLNDSIVLTQDPDVLDTWFSSALWAFSTLDWPHSEDFKRYYPTQLLVTGFDIIFFWVARMIMMGLKFTNQIPFEKVYITGLIRDHEGQKMSKSKGNVLDPIDLVDGIDLDALLEKRTNALMQPHLIDGIKKATREQFPQGIKTYGTDALRYTYYSLASPGRNIRFDTGRLHGYHYFCNKLWNATRYVLMNTDETVAELDPNALTFSLPDRWIWSKLQETIEQVHRHFKAYRFDRLTQVLYDFAWHHYCDWYLEFSKLRMNDASRYGLVHVLEQLLRLLHPMMPFITETLWLNLKGRTGFSGETLMLMDFPEVDPTLCDFKLHDDVDWLKKMIVSIRTIRSERNISPAHPLPLLLKPVDSAGDISSVTMKRLKDNHMFLMTLAKLERIDTLKGSPPSAATALVNDLELLIPLSGLIDVDQETARLSKAIEKLAKEIGKLMQKLNNPNYVLKAPAEIVDKDRTRLEALQKQSARLTQQRVEIATTT